MTPEQIIILIILFLLSFFGYWFFKRRLQGLAPWLKYNLIFLAFGIVGAVIFTPFSYPYSFVKNLPVFTIIPFCAYSIFYIVHDVLVNNDVKSFVKEIFEMLAIIVGSFIGMILINLLHIGSFRKTDIEIMSFVVLLFSLARILFNYSRLENFLRKNQTDLLTLKMNEHHAKSQLDFLNSKINSHFLYNSLNSIAALATVDGKKTKDMTISLSKLLRYSLNSYDDNFATLEEEMEMVQAYFEMEKIRFEEKLNFEIILPDEVRYYLVPRFLLQPIVENAVKHALKETENDNFVKVNVYLKNNELVITIHDNGKAFPEKIIPGYGLKSVNDKLGLLYSGKHEFQIINQPEKQIKIIIKELKTKNECRK